MRPLMLGSDGRRLFGTLHPAKGIARAAVLVCAPFLHEHVRSYRFFGQVADALAEGGMTVLRFDYFGTGDSGGDDGEFLPDAAVADIEVATGELRRHAGLVPLALLGVRAGALLAHAAAQRVDASALWLWQPVLDGAAYVDVLQARDLRERQSRGRYPMRRDVAPADPGDLMGFRVGGEFHARMSRLSITAPAPCSTIVLDESADAVAASLGARALPLPASLTTWADEVDLLTLIPLRDAQPAIECLLQDPAIRSVRP
jgi:pimeloyl-ACP methyl ester carboxylesterase